MQYTVRAIPRAVDQELRRRARQEGKSLNEAAVEALTRGVGLGIERVRQRDLSDLAGTWAEDEEFDRAVRKQHRVDRKLWR